MADEHTPAPATTERPTLQVLVSRLGLSDPRWRAQAEVELVNLGRAAVPALIAALQQHGSALVRYHAAQVLGRIGADEAIAPLAESLGDSENHSAVANAAEKFLVGSFGVRAIPLLLEMARTGPPQTRPRIVRALGRIGSTSGGVGLSQLKPSLKDVDPAVRTQAVTAAGALGGASAVPDLIAALSDESDWVRNAAAEALVDLKRAAGRDLLRKVAAEDEDMYTRHWAEELLDRIEELERTGDLVV